MNKPGERILRVGHGLFDSLSGELSLDGRTVKLRPRTAALLSHLVHHGDRMVGKDELMQAIWPDVVVTEDSLVQCVEEIRQALGQAGRDWIRTVPRQGYAFVGNPLDQAAPLASLATAPSFSTAPAPRWRQLAAFGLVAAFIVVGALALRGWRNDQPARTPVPPLSIVVMPVANLTGDAAQENTADDMTEALADALARMSRTIVIAPSTAFTFKGISTDVRRIGAELNVRYVLEGSLRMVASRPVLTMRLAEASTAVQLWSQDFTSGPYGMPALREDVIGHVAETLGLQLIRAEARRSGRPGAMHAAELLSRARAVLRWSGQDTERVLQARTLLEETVRLDSELASAWALLAMTHLHEVRFSATREMELRRAGQAIERALTLAPDSDAVRLVEGNVYYEQGRMAQALAAFERAAELNPNNAAALGFRASALVMLGRPDEALAPIEQAMRLSPRDPLLTAWQMFAGVAHLHLGHDATAVDWLTRAVEGKPRSAFGHLFLARALGVSGRIAEAQAQMAQLQQLRPGFTLSRFRAVEPSDAAPFRMQREHVYEGLRKAGMPL